MKNKKIKMLIFSTIFITVSSAVLVFSHYSNDREYFDYIPMENQYVYVI